MDKLINKLKWALIASVILNAFLLGGIVAGAYKMFGHGRPPFGERGGGPLHFAADELPMAQKKLFKKSMSESRSAALPLMKASGDARAEVIKQLSAPTLDKHAIENALAHAREADTAVRIHMEESLVHFAETLSAQDRQKLSEGLAKKGPLRQPPMLKEPPPEKD